MLGQIQALNAPEERVFPMELKMVTTKRRNRFTQEFRVESATPGKMSVRTRSDVARKPGCDDSVRKCIHVEPEEETDDELNRVERTRWKRLREEIHPRRLQEKDGRITKPLFANGMRWHSPSSRLVAFNDRDVWSAALEESERLTTAESFSGPAGPCFLLRLRKIAGICASDFPFEYRETRIEESDDFFRGERRADEKALHLVTAD